MWKQRQFVICAHNTVDATRRQEMQLHYSNLQLNNCIEQHCNAQQCTVSYRIMPQRLCIADNVNFNVSKSMNKPSSTHILSTIESAAAVMDRAEHSTLQQQPSSRSVIRSVVIASKACIHN